MTTIGAPSTGCSGHDNEADNASNRRVWLEESEEVIVHSFAFWEGGSRFRADRERLTDEQLLLLSNLELTAPESQCIEDLPSYSVEIRDADGTVREFRAADGDMSCSDETEVISMASLTPFLATYSCLSAGQTRNAQNTIDDALTIDVGGGCEHGFFGGPIWLKVNIDHPGSYAFRGVNCSAQESTIALYSEDGHTLLNEGGAEAAPGCWAVEHDVEAAGSYFLLIDGTQGDYFVRMTEE